jgi:hypothetical protein
LIDSKKKISKIDQKIDFIAVNLLTPTTLRWSTLSATSRKEGEKNHKPSFPLSEESLVDPPPGGKDPVSKL